MVPPGHASQAQMTADTAAASRSRRSAGWKAIVDVSYSAEQAVAACVPVDAWSASEPAEVATAQSACTAEYQPGMLFCRELPPILRVLEEIGERVETIVVDGHVWLDRSGRPGLGAKLYQALDEKVRVVGVAKTRFGDGGHEMPVLRGTSRRPLYVTAAGMPSVTAASWIRRMHGEHRIPTLLRLADRLSRTG